MLFGFFKGLPYENCNEDFETYRSYKNRIPRNEILKHIESLEAWLASPPSYDAFTGEKLHAGMFWDGDFTFPYEFLHYYKNYDIGIPYEYEEYLKSIGVGQDK
jgi:hypothetical protein